MSCHCTVSGKSALAKRGADHENSMQCQIRAGSTPETFAQLVGTRMPRYCLFGGTVNLQQMECSGVPEHADL